MVAAIYANAAGLQPLPSKHMSFAHVVSLAVIRITEAAMPTCHWMERRMEIGDILEEESLRLEGIENIW